MLEHPAAELSPMETEQQDWIATVYSTEELKPTWLGSRLVKNKSYEQAEAFAEYIFACWGFQDLGAICMEVSVHKATPENLERFNLI